MYLNLGLEVNINASCVALNTVFKSTSFFYDTATAAAKQLSNNFRWGASHDIPISLSLPALGPLQISPRVSYQEKWYQEKFALSWNPANKKIDTSIQRGFYTAREMSYGIGVSSRIFGMIGFNKNSKVQAIRHEIRPSIGLNYKPDMNARNFYTIQQSYELQSLKLCPAYNQNLKLNHLHQHKYQEHHLAA